MRAPPPAGPRPIPPAASRDFPTLSAAQHTAVRHIRAEVFGGRPDGCAMRTMRAVILHRRLRRGCQHRHTECALRNLRHQQIALQNVRAHLVQRIALDCATGESLKRPSVAAPSCRSAHRDDSRSIIAIHLQQRQRSAPLHRRRFTQREPCRVRGGKWKALALRHQRIHYEVPSNSARSAA